VCLAFFALAFPAITYSAEVKHYGFDLMAGAFFVWVVYYLRDHGTKPSAVIVFNGAAAALALFSYPMVFCAASVVMVMVLMESGFRPRLNAMVRWSLWLPFFAAHYAWEMMRYPDEVHESYEESWSGGFWPLDVFDPTTWVWPFAWISRQMVFIVFYRPVSLLLTVLLLAGIVVAIRQRSRGGLVAALTIGLALLASLLQMYPPVARLGSFMLPACVILFGLGLVALSRVGRIGSWAALVVGVVMVAAAGSFTVQKMATRGIEPVRPGHQISAFKDYRIPAAFLRENLRPDDRLLVTFLSIPSFALNTRDVEWDMGRVWLEGADPFRDDLDLSNPREIAADQRDQRFSYRDADRVVTLTPRMVEFMEKAVRDEGRVIVLVTHSPWNFDLRVALMAEVLGDPQRHPFPGGVFVIFGDGGASSGETNG